MIKYESIILNKAKILEENKGKTGVYRWINRTTCESYVGSSTNLAKRLSNYYSNSYLISKTLRYNSLIYKAILNYNLPSFNLEILEYCDKKSVFNREQYYMDLLKPEYNILKKAGSSLGFQHSAETLLKFKTRVPSRGHITIVLNKDKNNSIKYSSVCAAAKGIGVSPWLIRKYLNTNKLLKNNYLIYK